MEKCHKDQIEKYHGYLIENTNFDALWEKLKHDTELFQAYMTEDILSTSDIRERNERFYDLIQECGHTAFKKLTAALSSSGQNNLSLLLLDNKFFCTELDIFKLNHYPPLPPLITQVEVLKSPKPSQWTDVRQKDPRYSYYVRSRPRGYLLLVNMRFAGNPLEDERKGSEVDVRNLKELFSQLNYEIIDRYDLTLDEMENTVHNFSNMEELKTVDSVVVFVMSHGRNPSQRHISEPPLKSPGRESVDIELEDNKFINSNDIVDEINGSSTIRPNVPKLFFFNICRGSKADMGPNYYSSGFSDSSFQDTSTEVDARPFNINSPYFNHSETHNSTPTSIPMLNGNQNGNVVNQISRIEQTEPSPQESLSPNGNETNNGMDVPPPVVTMLNPNLPMTEEFHIYDETVCCCYQITNDKFKRKTMCTRLAIWLSKKFKCSMPTQVEEIEKYRPYNTLTKEDKSPMTNGTNGTISSHPSGSRLRRGSGGSDSPDSGSTTGTVEVVWPMEPVNPEIRIPEMHEVPLVTRSNSKLSKTGSPPIFDRILGIVQRKKNQERSGKLMTGDIFMAFSTVDGYNSKRHPQRGSWFVTLICQVFAESAKDTDLISMMEEVDRRLREMFDTKYGRQLYVKKTEGFSRKFFFNVDLDQENESVNNSES